MRANVRGFLLALGAVLAPVAAAAQMMMTGAGGASGFVYSPSIGALFNIDTALAQISGVGTANGLSISPDSKMTVAFAVFGSHDISGAQELNAWGGATFINAPFLGQSGNITATLCNAGCTAAGNVLTVSSVNKTGTFLEVGEPIYNVGTLLGTITALGTGAGGTGTYTLSSSTTFLSTGTALIAAGTDAEASNGWSPGVAMAFDNTAGEGQLNFNDATGSAANATKFNGVTGHSLFPSGVWNYYVITFDTVTGAFGITRNGVDQVAAGNAVKTVMKAGALVALNDPNGFGFANATVINNGFSAAYMGIADVLIAPGVSYACTGVGAPYADCTAANTIEPAFMAKLYANGKVLDYGTNCALPTGSQPPLCYRFKPGALTVNEGSLGNVLSTMLFPNYSASLNAAALFEMPYGPGTGLTPGQPTLNWVTEKGVLIQPTTGGTTTAPTLVASTATYPIGAGDLLVLIPQVVFNAAAADPVITCPTGWTQLGGAGADFYDTTNRHAIAVCTIVGTPANLTYSWSNAASVAYRWKGWIMLDYGQTSGLDAGSTCALQTASTTIKTPASVTLSTNNETVVSVFGLYRATASSFGLPTRGMTRFRSPQSLSGAGIVVSDQYGQASGGLTQTQYALGTSTAVTTCSLGIKP